MKLYHRFFYIFIFSIFISACGALNPFGSDIDADKVTPAEEIDKNRAYQLATGDKIRVTVSGEEGLSGEFALDAQGMISLPHIREVSAKGLTFKELEKRIAAQFLEKEILKDPRISVEVLSYRPFYIDGAVMKGGEYPFHPGMNLKNAIAAAGGYTYRAEIDIAYVRREGSENIIKVKPGGQTFPVHPGDNIQIPERFF